MHQRLPILFILLFLTSGLLAQKPAMTQKDIDHWNSINAPRLSNDGQWASYRLTPNDGDPTLMLHNNSNQKEWTFPRSKQGQFSADSRYFAFISSPPRDTIRAQKRRKVKEKEQTKDTLSIVTLSSGNITQIARTKNYQLSQKWEGWLAYQLEPFPRDTTLPDSVKVKKENEKNGSRLVIRNLRTGQEDTIPYVKSYIAAEESARFLIHSTGDDSTFQAGTYLYDCPSRKLQALLSGEGSYTQLAMNEAGTQVAFLAFRDTTLPRAVPYELYHWKENWKEARSIADSSLAFLPDQWMIGEHYKLTFSEDNSKLFFGIAPPPVLQDTSLLDEEIVNVEVWHYQDARLYTQEEVMLKEEKKRSYDCVYHIADQKIVQLATLEVPEVRLGNEGNAPFALGMAEEDYLSLISWEGFPGCKDVFVIDVRNGSKTLVGKKICGQVELSPHGDYAYWYSSPDSAWYAYSIENKTTNRLAPELDVPFYDELNDRPMHPYPYGIAGWTTDDDFIMIYDRYDIWLIDPLNNLAPNNLTEGRASRKTYRYIKLDTEARSIEEVGPMLFHQFDEKDKSSGYVWFNIHTGVKEQIQSDHYNYTRRVVKARDANHFLFTRESFEVFPDLLLSKDNLKSYRKISDANPQQQKVRWGTAEPYSWTGADGQTMEGILIKPEGFDPSMKYPCITYFYERYADRLHTHWTPRYPRSIINFPYYASRGYVIFIPDIHYRVGYPGESALDAITSGVTSLIDEGFVDKENMGVQGHSWGGYQVAYLITQTDLFKCAESGAPVVNMISAYGGIRWGSGLSRMFQYERTQSRLGGTLWDKPLRYIENSPLFYADKINTPVLILHNDEDGAVPWYQGIEFFVALRRLGKPAWLLNYNEDPHGVRKPQNRRDFQQRMQQFFDYYLLDAPKPRWMEEGVKPIDKGINQGLEPVEGKKP
jgi:dienelactone hydrolase